MRAGDTILTNLIGVSVSSFGLPPDSAEVRSLEQERSLVQWISIKSQAFFSEHDPESFLRPVTDHPREIDALRATLEEHGVPTVPPMGWKPYVAPDAVLPGIKAGHPSAPVQLAPAKLTLPVIQPHRHRREHRRNDR